MYMHVVISILRTEYIVRIKQLYGVTSYNGNE